MAEKKIKKWKMRFRISVLNESTLTEVWHTRMSRAGMATFFLSIFLLAFVILVLLFTFTPLRNYVQKYHPDNVRPELMAEIVRVDSLQRKLELQTGYLTIVRDIMAGEVSADSIVPLDSLTIVERTQLLEEKSALMQQFMQEQEAKSVDQLVMFAPAEMQTAPVFFNPLIDKNIVAVLTGTVVSLMPSLDGHWIIMVQHADGYLSQYSNLDKVLKKEGEQVRVGETIGIIEDPQTFSFGLWHNGKRIDYEDISNTR